METKASALYKILSEKKSIENQFIEEIKEAFLQNQKVVKSEKVSGCRFLRTVRKSELKEWDSAFGRGLDEAQSALINKLQYMTESSRSTFLDIVNMLKRIVRRGVTGVFKGRGELNYISIMEEYDGKKTQQEYMRDNFVGHFHHNHGAYTLSEISVKNIEQVLKSNNLIK